MAMFPIFMLGIVAGILISYVFFHYVKTIPTNTKFKLQEDTIKNEVNNLFACIPSNQIELNSGVRRCLIPWAQ